MTKPLFEYETSVLKSEVRQPASAVLNGEVGATMRVAAIDAAWKRAEATGWVVDRLMRFKEYGPDNLSAGTVTLVVHQADE